MLRRSWLRKSFLKDFPFIFLRSTLSLKDNHTKQPKMRYQKHLPIRQITYWLITLQAGDAWCSLTSLSKKKKLIVHIKLCVNHSSYPDFVEIVSSTIYTNRSGYWILSDKEELWNGIQILWHIHLQLKTAQYTDTHSSNDIRTCGMYDC